MKCRIRFLQKPKVRGGNCRSFCLLLFNPLRTVRNGNGRPPRLPIRGTGKGVQGNPRESTGESLREYRRILEGVQENFLPPDREGQRPRCLRWFGVSVWSRAWAVFNHVLYFAFLRKPSALCLFVRLSYVWYDLVHWQNTDKSVPEMTCTKLGSVPTVYSRFAFRWGLSPDFALLVGRCRKQKRHR